MQNSAFKVFAGIMLGGATIGSGLQAHVSASPSASFFAAATAYSFAPEAIASLYSAGSDSDNAFLNRAAEMDLAGNYEAVIHQLAFISTTSAPLSAAQKEQWLFLMGRAMEKSGNPRCVTLLQEFLAEYPNALDARRAMLMLGDASFFASDWSGALEAYRNVDFSTLNSSQKNLYFYREAGCLIRRGFFDEAQRLLNSIADKKGYYTISLYYSAYIDYVKDKNAEAMRKFEEVADNLSAGNSDIKYSDVRETLYPEYYITQLLFREGDWSNCIKSAKNLLKRKSITDEDILAGTRRALGMSLYEEGDYAAARGNLEDYVNVVGVNASDDALYALGCCEYDADELTRAAERFSQLLSSRDAVAQGSYLFLGQIEAAKGNPTAAALNFEKAYRMNFDPKVAETALYNYAAACSKGGSIPFDTSRELLERFIERYPDSDYAPAVERYMAQMLCERNDYTAALAMADKLHNPTPSDKLLMQTILYKGGAAYLAEGDYAAAAKYLKRCVELKGVAPEVNCQAQICLGDALYNLENYPAAETAYRKALNSGHLTANKDLLMYDYGYALFMNGKYSEADKYFNLSSEGSSSLDASMRRDAAMRIADCRYYLGNFNEALKDFSALKKGGENADYATYRHAQLLGVTGDIKGKINELLSFEREFGNSRLLPDALSELGDTYASQDDPKNAAAAYERMLSKYPVAPGSGHSMLGLATAYMASGENDKGVAQYRNLISSRPASSEARLADKELRQYYASQHRLAEYAEFINNIPGYSLNASQMDDLTFEAAQDEWLAGGKGITAIKKYLEDYPEGKHAAEAWSAYAEYLYDKGRSGEACEAYRELERHGGAEYAAEAYAGIMRTASNRGVRLDYARKLLEMGGVPSELLDEAKLTEARELLSSKNAAERKSSLGLLTQLAENPRTSVGAQSAVILGGHYLAQGDAEKCKSLMEKFTSSGSNQQYWVARGFILLADAYTALGKDYLAKEYLRSLKQNYPGDEDDIKVMIEKRLK